jgi:hypothetical protein
LLLKCLVTEEERAMERRVSSRFGITGQNSCPIAPGESAKPSITIILLFVEPLVGQNPPVPPAKVGEHCAKHYIVFDNTGSCLKSDRRVRLFNC